MAENDVKITSIGHVGILVEDLDEAMAKWEALGVGPWDEPTVFGGTDDPIIENGRDARTWGHICTFSICHSLNVEIELIEPGDVGPYADWARRHGYGLQHLYITNDGGYRPMIEAMNDHRERYIDGVWPQEQGEDLEWVYLDLIDELGSVFEVSKTVF